MKLSASFLTVTTAALVSAALVIVTPRGLDEVVRAAIGESAASEAATTRDAAAAVSRYNSPQTADNPSKLSNVVSATASYDYDRANKHLDFTSESLAVKRVKPPQRRTRRDGSEVQSRQARWNERWRSVPANQEIHKKKAKEYQAKVRQDWAKLKLAISEKAALEEQEQRVAAWQALLGAQKQRAVQSTTDASQSAGTPSLPVDAGGQPNRASWHVTSMADLDRSLYLARQEADMASRARAAEIEAEQLQSTCSLDHQACSNAAATRQSIDYDRTNKHLDFTSESLSTQRTKPPHRRTRRADNEARSHDAERKQLWLSIPGNREIHNKRVRERRAKVKQFEAEAKLAMYKKATREQREQRVAAWQAMPEPQKQRVVQATKEAQQTALTQLYGDAPRPWERWQQKQGKATQNHDVGSNSEAKAKGKQVANLPSSSSESSDASLAGFADSLEDQLAQ